MVTLSEALKAFLMQREVDGRSKRTLGFYQGKIEIFIAFVGDKPVKDLTIQDGQNFVLEQASRPRYKGHRFKRPQTEPMSRSTLRGYVRAIKVWASFLFDEGYTKTNVFAKLKLPKATQRVVDVLSEDEIKRLFEGMNPNTF